MIYDIEFALAAKRLLPPFLRQLKQIAWLTALVKPLQELRDDIFDTYMPDVKKRMRYNGQTVVLEAILNQFYSLTSGDLIYIESASVESANVFVGESGSTSFYVGKTANTAHAGASYDLNAFNFTIYVPVSLTYVEAELRALVDGIRPAGTVYDIQTY